MTKYIICVVRKLNKVIKILKVSLITDFLSVNINGYQLRLHNDIIPLEGI